MRHRPANSGGRKRVTRREIRELGGVNLQVQDDFALCKESADLVQHLMTPCEVELLKDGQFRLRNDKTGVDLMVRYDPPQLLVRVETIPVEDTKLQELWGPQLQRIQIRPPRATSHDVWTHVIRPSE